MNGFPGAFPAVTSDRVNAVGRVTADSLRPVLRGTDGLQSGYPLPKKVQPVAEDVALFERLVFGEAFPEKLSLLEGRTGTQAAALGAEFTSLNKADRIATTLRHLGCVRGL